jgi:hypothetical protein
LTSGPDHETIGQLQEQDGHLSLQEKTRYPARFCSPAVMGSNVVSLWEQVVKLLQSGTKNPASCGDPLLYEHVTALLEKLESLSPPPRSVWKKLVQQQQVRKLLTLQSCLKAGQNGTAVGLSHPKSAQVAFKRVLCSICQAHVFLHHRSPCRLAMRSAQHHSTAATAQSLRA